MNAEELAANLKTILEEVESWNNIELNEFGKDTRDVFISKIEAQIKNLKMQSRTITGKLHSPQCGK